MMDRPAWSTIAVFACYPRRLFASGLLAMIVFALHGIAVAHPQSPISHGNSLRRAGKYREALEIFQEYLQKAKRDRDIDGEWVARGFSANTFADLGKIDEAMRLHQENLAFAKAHANVLIVGPMDRARESLLAMGHIQSAQQNWGKAIELERQVLASMDKNPRDYGLGRPKVLEELGMNLYHSGQPREAERVLREAIQAHDEARENRLGPLLAHGINVKDGLLMEYEGSVDVYRWLEEVLIAGGDTNAALEASEEGRAAALIAVLRSRLGLPEALLPKRTPPTLGQIKEIVGKSNATAVVYSVAYDSTRDVSDRSARIIFGYEHLTPRNLFIWVIRPTGEVAFRDVESKRLSSILNPTDTTRGAGAGARDDEKKETLSRVVTNLHTALGIVDRGIALVPAEKGGARHTSPELQQLYRLLVAPIEEYLPRDPSDHVVFVPQDALFAIPFAALQDEHGAYLIENHTILVAPSIETLDVLGQLRSSKPGASDDVLVVGNPSPMPKYGNPPLPLRDLPGAAREAQRIAAILNIEALIGPQATKAAVMQHMKTARLIHLATHGILDPEDVTTDIRPGGAVRNDAGLESSIALAPSNEDSGFLTAKEVIQMNLNADLVVLSACNSGRGAVRGDGIVGLSRAFMEAGVPSLITSLWGVPDEPTSALMIEFYRRIEHSRDKADALREAMLTTMRDFPEPRDWAAFELLGRAD